MAKMKSSRQLLAGVCLLGLGSGVFAQGSHDYADYAGKCMSGKCGDRCALAPPADSLSNHVMHGFCSSDGKTCQREKPASCKGAGPDRNQCPENAEYKECGTKCPSVCMMAYDLCDRTCVEGCQCKQGYSRLFTNTPAEPLQGEVCVKTEECYKMDCSEDTPDSWSKAKRMYCCHTQKLGCPQFDCYTKEVWSEEKQKWCCKNKQLGCADVEPVPRFNCLTKEKWSEEKRKHCCRTQKLGCNLGEKTDETDRCLGGAGYTWCERLNKCVREWETPCNEEVPEARWLFGKVSTDGLSLKVKTKNGPTFQLRATTQTKFTGVKALVDIKETVEAKVSYEPNFEKYADMKPHDGLVAVEVVVLEKPREEVPCEDLIARSTFGLGAYKPQCNDISPDLYNTKQCWERECWCVNPRTNEREGELSSEGECGLHLGRHFGSCPHGFMWCAEESKCYRSWEEDCGGRSPPLDLYGVIVDVDKPAKFIVVQASDEEKFRLVLDDTDLLVFAEKLMKKGETVQVSYVPDEEKHGDRNPHDGLEVHSIEGKKAVKHSGSGHGGSDHSDSGSSSHGKLWAGDVCKIGSVEMGYFVDRSKECPFGTVCKAKGGKYATGGDVDHTCQRRPKKQRDVSIVAKEGATRKDAIAKAKEFAEALLKSLKSKSGGHSVIEVLVKFVCEIPSVRAALGVTDEDRKSDRCSAVEGAHAEESDATPPAGGVRRNLQPLGGNGKGKSVVLDTEIRTDDKEEPTWVTNTIADIAGDSKDAVAQVIPIEPEQVTETTTSVAAGWDKKGHSHDGQGGPRGHLGPIMAGLAGVIAVSGCSVFMLQYISKRKATPDERSHDHTEIPIDSAVSPASGGETSFRAAYDFDTKVDQELMTI
eukprot:Hpha_TRINITY_DN15241_c2_g1::TRINITY_DN15241_c2_g1_i1::g.66264::m.66264